MENWKDIKGYEGFYQVSDLGNIKSMSRTTNSGNNSTRFMQGRLLKPKLDSKKYYFMVNLSKYGIIKTRLLHRLIAEVFIPNPQNLPQVNHIDGNKQNNLPSNLEWCNQKQNSLHAFQTLKVKRLPLKRDSCHLTKIKSSQVEEIIKLRDNKIPYKQIAMLYGMSISGLEKIIKKYKNVKYLDGSGYTL